VGGAVAVVTAATTSSVARPVRSMPLTFWNAITACWVSAS
jgi:hypothetical protein